MATRLYMLANTVPSVSPAFDTAWQSSAQAQRRRMLLYKLPATETWGGALGGAVNDNDCVVMGISPPLQGDQTLSGTMTLISRGRELAANDNVNNRGRTVRVFTGDGQTVRGTAEANAYSASTTELSTTMSGQQHSLNGGLTSVSALHGDIIVVELGYRETVTGTTPNWETSIGGDGTDHATTNNDTTGTVPWVEFSANLVFQAELPILVMAPPILS